MTRLRWNARDGILLNCERTGLREFLTERQGALNDAAFMTAARLPGVAFDSTISALTGDRLPPRPRTPLPGCASAGPGGYPRYRWASGSSTCRRVARWRLSRPPTELGLPAEQSPRWRPTSVRGPQPRPGRSRRARSADRRCARRPGRCRGAKPLRDRRGVVVHYSDRGRWRHR